MFKKTFDRAKQTVGEKFGDAITTEYDPDVQVLLQRSEDVKTYTQKILSSIEVYLQPDPSIRMLPGLTQEGLNKPETVASELGHLAGKLEGTDYGKALKTGEITYSKIGGSEREYLAAANQQYFIPIKRFLNEDIKKLEEEKKVLGNRRLDMDSLKNKASKSPENKTLAEDLEKAKKSFEEQQASVKELVQTKVESQFPALQKALKDLVNAHVEHLKKQEKLLTDFAKVL